VDASDTYDDFADSLSHDNGRTWSVPRPALRSRETPEGRLRYAENACFFDSERERLFAFACRALDPRGHHDPDRVWEAVHDEYDPSSGAWRCERKLDVAIPGGFMMSFCFPILTSREILLVPAFAPVLGPDGRPLHYEGCRAPMHEAVTIRGTRRSDGSFAYGPGRPARLDPERSCRGLSENTLAELRDGRIAMVARGDNSRYPERPGYKWVCFSEDEGASWSEPQPLGCDQGEPLESGSSGCALLRSVRSGKLYLIANLCTRGERPNGNWPRSPLAIAEVRESPFAIKRASIAVIDDRAPAEPERVQHSNFRFYQDRLTGELVLFLTRYGEHGAKDWKRADYYRYRLPID
jgi:hypothetical protein